MSVLHPHDLSRVDRVLARDRWKAVRRWLLAPIQLYCFATLIYWALRLLVGERSIDGDGPYLVRLLGGFVGSASSLMPALLLPAVPLAVFALLLRGWRALAVLLMNLAALGFLYGELFMPQNAPAAATADAFTLVSYNMHSDPRADVIARQAALLQTFDADLLVLQEMSQSASEAFVPLLSAEYPYQILFPVGNSVQGTGVFSRYPLSGESVWYQPNYISAMRVEVALGARTLLLYNVHPTVPSLSPLAYSTSRRDSAIRDLLDRAAREDAALPFIMAGDFNLNDQSPIYQTLATAYHDSMREAGTGFNASWPDVRAAFPGSSAIFAYVPPLVRIDYIFHNDAIRVLDVRAHNDSGGSDHYPLVTRMAFAPAVR